MWAVVFGGRWYDPRTGEITADDPKNVRALAWMASRARPEDLRKMSALEPSFGAVFSATSPYYNGRIGFRISGEYERHQVDTYKPGFDWGFAPLPHPPGGRARAAPVGGSVFVVPAASKHKNEAWEFLNWLTQPAQTARFNKAIGNLP